MVQKKRKCSLTDSSMQIREVMSMDVYLNQATSLQSVVEL